MAPGSDFPDWLRARMAEKRWSAADLARAAKVGQSSISNYQLGTRPSMQTVLKIAKAVGIAPAEALEVAGYDSGDASRDVDPIIPEIRLIVEQFSPAEQERLIGGIRSMAGLLREALDAERRAGEPAQLEPPRRRARRQGPPR